MATIGMDMLYYAKITEGTDGETYGEPKRLGKSISADLSVEVAEATLYADDAASEVVREFSSGSLTLGLDDISKDVAKDLFGVSVDANGVSVYATEDVPEYVALGFRCRKANGKYRYFWLYKVKFGVPSLTAETKGDSITFVTPSLEGTVMRRDQLDAYGRHPWRTEVTEGDSETNQSTIENWFNKVYEPIKTTSVE